MHSFFIFSQARDPKHCAIYDEPEALKPESWRISDGLPMDEHFPSGLVLQMASEHKGIVLTDLVGNTLRMAIVSSRLKSLIEEHAGANVEFLPLSISNHKGRIAAKDYFIANVLDHQDCIDLEHSEVEQLGLEPGRLSGLFRLRILADRIPAEAKLFRLKSMPVAILIRDDLRAVLVAAGLTGVRYIGMGERCRIY